MKRKDPRAGETRTEPQPEQRDPRERTVAPPIGPPIEREHETQKGIFEEEEQRKHERH